MSKKALFPQSPRHILIYDQDWEYLQRCYGPGSDNPAGVSNMIRSLVHRAVETLRARTEAQVEAVHQAQQGGAK